MATPGPRGGARAIIALGGSHRRWLCASRPVGGQADGRGGRAARGSPVALRNPHSAAQKPARAVAVIGGGLAGLSVTYHMLNITRGRHQALDVTIIDQSEVGQGGATGAMAGILDKVNPRGRLLWMGDEGIEASLKLVGVAARHSDAALRTHGLGVVHLARNERQEEDFREAAMAMPAETEILSVPETEALRGVSGGDRGETHTGLRVKRGCAVRGSDYTKALLAACRELGQVTWEVERVESLAAVAARGFDHVIVCAGAACLDIEELRGRVPIKRARAQNIEYVVRAGREGEAGSLGTPIICGKYLVPFEGPNGGVLCGGSTREEHEGTGDEPDLRRAREELHEPLSALFEPIRSGAWVPSQAKAGVKALAPRMAEGRIPSVGKLRLDIAGEASFWLFTGLGSRGLIHHAVLGELLARAVLEGDESVLPSITRRLPILGGEVRAPTATRGARKGH